MSGAENHTVLALPALGSEDGSLEKVAPFCLTGLSREGPFGNPSSPWESQRPCVLEEALVEPSLPQEML